MMDILCALKTEMYIVLFFTEFMKPKKVHRKDLFQKPLNE